MNKELLHKINTFVAVVITIVVYVVVFVTLNRGTSCDEGFYLMGYAANQSIGFGVSDFHYIVRFFFGWLGYDNAMSLRYVRYILTVVSLIVFALSSYYYLYKRLQVNKKWFVIYISVMLFSGALSFGFASPVLYYDSIQLFLYLFAYSLLFLSLVDFKGTKVFTLFIGVFIVFAIFNYLPSGLFLILSVVFLLIISRKNEIHIYISILLGILLGLILYHFFIHNLSDYYIQLSGSFQQAQTGITHHSNLQLIVELISFMGNGLLYVSPVFALYIFTQFLSTKTNLNSKYEFSIILLLLILVFSIYSFFVKSLGSVYLFIPVFTVLLRHYHKASIFSDIRTVFFVLLFVSLPFMGIFGTNQALEGKSIYLIPFWSFLFFFLLFSSKSNSKLLQSIFTTNFIAYLSIAFLFLVYFNKYHYYYTPKRSNIELINLDRFNGVCVSPNQKEFICKVDELLKKSGFRSGDEMLAFEVDLITAYAVGAKIPDNLFYAHYNMTTSVDNIPKRKVNYILIYENSEKEMISFLKHTDWGFPQGYKRYELGKYAENMLEGMSSILYISEEK